MRQNQVTRVAGLLIPSEWSRDGSGSLGNTYNSDARMTVTKTYDWGVPLSGGDFLLQAIRRKYSCTQTDTGIE